MNPISKSQQENPIELRSEEIDEILGKAPNSIIRWGISIIFLLVLLVFAISYIVKYPETIKAEITLYSENMPATLVAKISGKISKIFVTANQNVAQDCPLLLLENNADYENIIQLKAIIDSISPYINQNKTEEIPALQTSGQSLILGEIQSYYASFEKCLNDFRRFQSLALLMRKLEAQKKQLAMTKLYYNRLYTQRNLMENDLALSAKEFRRDSSLFQNKVIPAAEFEKKESQYLQKKYAFEGSKTTLASTQIQIAQLEQQIVDIELQTEEQKQQLTAAIKQSFEALCNQYNAWQQTYLLKAPVSGKVVFNKFWSINQQVTANDKVVTVVPQGKSCITGRVQLPLDGAGKVKVNQKVLIRLNDYPYMEYGLVEAKVENISSVSEDKSWALQVKMPKELKTTYKKELSFKSGMTGQAEIITDDIRLIERFINPIKAVLKR